MKLEAHLLYRNDLSPREADVFELLCSGLSDKAIANQLGIHIKTVSKHIDHIYEKLGIRWQSINARCTAIGIAVARGMVQMVLHSVFAVLVLQTALLDDEAFARVRVRAPRVVRVRRVKA